MPPPLPEVDILPERVELEMEMIPELLFQMPPALSAELLVRVEFEMVRFPPLVVL